MKKMSVLLTIMLAIAFTLSAKSSDKVGLLFDGNDDVVIVPHAELLNPEAISVEAWVKVNAFESTKSNHGHSWQFILFKKNRLDSYNEGFALFLDDKNHRFSATVASKNGKQVQVIDAPGTVELGEWYHICLTADNKEMALYVNGNQVAKAKTDFELDFDEEHLYMGGREKGSLENTFGGRFNGEIDDVKYRSYVMNSSNIAKSMDEVNLEDPGLLLYYNFVEQKGNLSTDNKNEMQAALLNGTKWVEEKESKQQADILVAPSPVSSKAKIVINVENSEKADIAIFNSNGVLVHSFGKQLNVGENIINIDASTFPQGAYVVRVNSRSYSGSNTFIVAK